MKDYQTNTAVRWQWGRGTARGYIREKFTETVTRTIDGTEVKRNATKNDPAYLIEQSDGQSVLKLASELEKT